MAYVPIDGSFIGSIGKNPLNHRDTKDTRGFLCVLCAFVVSFLHQLLDPIEIAKPLATDKPKSETGNPAGKKPEITFTTMMPHATPIAAPTTESVTASIRNCMKISPSPAPIDLRSPISNKRSEIEIFSTEKMPTPPMSSEIPAMEKKTMRQLRNCPTMLPRSLRISLPTFSTRTS